MLILPAHLAARKPALGDLQRLAGHRCGLITSRTNPNAPTPNTLSPLTPFAPPIGLDLAWPRIRHNAQHTLTLQSGFTHEWFGVLDDHSDHTDTSQASSHADWLPPLTIIAHMARQLLGLRRSSIPPTPPTAVFIGQAVFPAPWSIAGPGAQDQLLLRHCLFVEARSPEERLWAMDQSLQTPGIGLVITDGRQLNLAATRRLQLAASAPREDDTSAIGVLIRPPHERTQLSAAHTRWLVRRTRSPDDQPRWTIQLLRDKSGGLCMHDEPLWQVGLDDATGTVRGLSDILDRSAQAS